jgi:hypothetical protein
MTVCKVDDEFVRDNMRWVVRLNNDELVYEDDGRPGEDPPSAWLRLGQYCRDNGLYITQMWLQFRSARLEVKPANALGYFFAKSVFAVWGEDQSYEAYVAGTLGADGKVRTTRWRVPELIELEQGTRVVELDSPFLICKPV